MNILGLGYVGINSTDIDGWVSFGQRLLSVQPVIERFGIQSRRLSFRTDEKAQRLLIEENERIGGAYYGLEVADTAALDAAATELVGHEVTVHAATNSELERRFVAGMVHFQDPAGNRIELFHGLANAATEFVPPRPISGFRTGSQGLGHAVFMVESVAAVLPFYTEVLGLGLSDYATKPFKAYFLHANTRHHTIALVETGRVGLHHLMLEVLSPDDVGQAYDRALLEEGRIGATLGRHTNDYMMSFYAWSPSRFMVEYGFGGRSVDKANWKVEELVHGPSIWGHDRTWLDEKRRGDALSLRLAAAEAGVRANVQVPLGGYDVYPTR